MAPADALEVAPLTPQRGVVATYDTVAGYGTIAAADGRTWWFHCTAIADGSRHIEVAAAVGFRVVAGRQGRWEAADIVPAPVAS